jgi:Fe-S-cluster containining protein
MRAVLRGEAEADVPCDGCVGCCVSSYPIPLRPTDAVALARVPDRYLQWASGIGQSARMGFREDGTCPMLAERLCTIYADRPRTCRDYDCRIYAAAGVLPDGNRPVIQQRVAEWCFNYEDEQASASAAAVHAAADFIRAHAASFPAAMRAHSATAAAVLAIKVYPLFMEGGDSWPVAERVDAVVEAARSFDAAKERAPQGPSV